MFKRLVSGLIALLLLGNMLCFATDNYGDNNTGANDNINEEITWLDSEVYNVSGGFVTDVTQKTTVSSFVANFKTPSNVSVVGALATAYVKTGDVVRYGTSSNEDCIAIVTGDIDANGQVSVTDIAKANNIIAGTLNLSNTAPAFIAADINGSGTVSVVDIVKIREIILG